MTPLEEIEEEIEFTRRRGRDILGPLYTARAIERLEATVRAIGVILQERLPMPEAFAFETPQPAPEPHAYYNPIPGRKLCGICGYERDAPHHTQEPAR